MLIPVQEKFPELQNFGVELDYMEKASLVSLENLQIDVKDLEKGMTQVKKEFEARYVLTVYMIWRTMILNCSSISP